MIIGSLSITGKTVVTHRDTYLIEQLTVVSVRRPLLWPLFAASFGLAGPAAAFADLLYAHEGLVIAGVAATLMTIGWRLGCLKLLSRDLRGSELEQAIWGDVSRLTRERHRIVRILTDARDQKQNSGERE